MVDVVLPGVTSNDFGNGSAVADSMYEMLVSLQDLQRRLRDGEHIERLRPDMAESLLAVDFESARVSLDVCDDGSLMMHVV